MAKSVSFVLTDSLPSLSLTESYSKNTDTQVSTMVLDPEEKMPDGNLHLCVIVCMGSGFPR